MEILGAELIGFERLLRETLAAGSRLSTAAILTQQEQRLSPIAGHQIIAAIMAANASVSDALGRSAEAHRLIERMGKRLGIDVSAYGDGRKPPEADVFTSAELVTPAAIV